MKPSELNAGSRVLIPAKVVQVIGQDESAESQWSAEVSFADGQRVQTNTRNCEPVADSADPDSDGKAEGGKKGKKKAFSSPPE